MSEMLRTPGGKALGAVFAILAVAAVVIVIRRSITSPEVAAANTRVFIDSATGKSFKSEIKVGEDIPILAPSGKNTGYPAEECYWTADGHVKETPTYVLVKEYAGSPGQPTFCPDCHRLVVGHNPRANANRKPPPTEAEYNARHSNSNSKKTEPPAPGTGSGRER